MTKRTDWRFVFVMVLLGLLSLVLSAWLHYVAAEWLYIHFESRPK